MRSRQEIKAIALQNFMANYWEGVGILFLLSLIIGLLSGLGIGFVIVPAFVVSSAFFAIALYFGDKKNTDISTCFSVGFSEFGRNLGCILLRSVFLILWSMLFWVPGIIMSYAYAMTEYILADCPDVKAMDAIKLSKKMMNGHKWELFVFDLSFLGWFWLSGLTGGILYIFYVGPYYEAARAGYYTELKNYVISTGAVLESEFSGMPAPQYGTPYNTGSGAYPGVNDTVSYSSPVASTERYEHTEMITPAGSYAGSASPVGSGPIISINPSHVEAEVTPAPAASGYAAPVSGAPDLATSLVPPVAGGYVPPVEPMGTSFETPVAPAAPVAPAYVPPVTPAAPVYTPPVSSGFDTPSSGYGYAADPFSSDSPAPKPGLKGKMARMDMDNSGEGKGSDEEMAYSGFKRPTDF